MLFLLFIIPLICCFFFSVQFHYHDHIMTLSMNMMISFHTIHWRSWDWCNMRHRHITRRKTIIQSFVHIISSKRDTWESDEDTDWRVKEVLFFLFDWSHREPSTNSSICLSIGYILNDKRKSHLYHSTELSWADRPPGVYPGNEPA